MVKLFLAHGAGGRERAAARHIVVGLGGIGLEAQQIGFALGHLGGQRGVVGIQGAGLARGLGQLRLGLGQLHQIVGRVQLHQQLAGPDIVGIVGADADHGAADLGRDLHHVAGHIGVVRGLVVAGHHPVPAAPGDGGHGDSGRHDGQALAAARRVGAGRSCRRSLGSVLSRLGVGHDVGALLSVKRFCAIEKRSC
jgi:hypothetical protein